jgi:cysteine synthase
MKANNILETIGNTPHIKINKLFRSDLEVWVKVESFNPGGSIKDRIALAMIETAETDGILKPGTVIVEPTSGNTGIGLALVAAVKGYKLILVMPESMSLERRRILKLYGAELELTPREKGMKGAIQRATELTASLPSAWMPSQFENPANVRIHEKTTAEEILRDFPEGFDYLITGVGTGGHITGVAKRLKKAFPKLKVIAVEPELSPVLSGGNPGPHPIQGIGAGFVPAIYDPSLVDEIITVNKDEAFSFARRAALEEGLFVGISSGSSLAAVNKKSLGIKDGSRILTFAYDTGERYLSVDDLF